MGVASGPGIFGGKLASMHHHYVTEYLPNNMTNFISGLAAQYLKEDFWTQACWLEG